MMTQSELLEKGYQALVETLGVVDAVKFLQHFSHGSGDYTKERRQWLEGRSPEDVLADMRKWKELDNLTDFDEVL
jgi:hypothetical protein